MLFHRTPPAKRSGASSSVTEVKIWRVAMCIWIYRNPLKSQKTTKTFLGKAWHWNHTFLEKLGKSLEVARPDRAGLIHPLF
jgi:hypothetical protein